MFREINMTSRLNGRCLTERREKSRGEAFGGTETCECSIRKTERNGRQEKFTEMKSCDLLSYFFFMKSILKTFIFNSGREEDFLRGMKNALRFQQITVAKWQVFAFRCSKVRHLLLKYRFSCHVNWLFSQIFIFHLNSLQIKLNENIFQDVKMCIPFIMHMHAKRRDL